MKNHNFSLVAVGVLIATLTLISTAFSGPQDRPADVKSVDVRFQKDKVYEFVFFSVAKGKEAQLYQQYLPAAKPYFQKHGVKLLGMFSVTESKSKVLDSKMAAIFEWPNHEAKLKLEEDAGFKQVAKLREGAFSFGLVQ